MNSIWEIELEETWLLWVKRRAGGAISRSGIFDFSLGALGSVQLGLHNVCFWIFFIAELIKYGESVNTGFVWDHEFWLISAGAEQTLVGDQPNDIRVAFDLVDVPVLMVELAADTIRAVSLSKERLTVLIFLLYSCLTCQFLSTVSEFAEILVATVSVFAIGFAKFCLKQSLILVMSQCIGMPGSSSCPVLAWTGL